ncbi:unnamed protein product [Fraxinus pennsylvanica]|uniref:Uncharacterized protein n=1 Tax=Fraxinus pennsylvanica TaxID=56036 RepID=A0AAD2DU97_9LAMI|nr:unnamed protein product [Fraxinus pennsylvanica]
MQNTVAFVHCCSYSSPHNHLLPAKDKYYLLTEKESEKHCRVDIVIHHIRAYPGARSANSFLIPERILEAQNNTELKEYKLPGVESVETEESASSSFAAPSKPETKIKFDLNEGLIADDGKYGEPVLKESKLPSVESDETEESAYSSSSSSSFAAPSKPETKIKFDLNEGLIADDGKYGEPVNCIAPDSTNVHLINSLLSATNGKINIIEIKTNTTSSRSGTRFQMMKIMGAQMRRSR